MLDRMTRYTFGCILIMLIQFGIALGIMIGLFGFFVPTAHAAIASDSVVGIWLLDEGKGFKTYEHTGNFKHAWLLGEPGHRAEWEPGKFGACLNFLGKPSVSIGDSGEHTPNEEITITAWSKILDATRVGWYRWYHLNPNTVRAYAGAQMFIEDNKEKVRWVYGSPVIRLIVDWTPVEDVWQHWAFTHSVRDSRMAIYQDGKLFAEVGDSSALNSTQGWGNIGPIPGLIDDVGVFNRALTQAEIQFIMRHGLASALAVQRVGKLASTWGEIKAK